MALLQVANQRYDGESKNRQMKNQWISFPEIFPTDVQDYYHWTESKQNHRTDTIRMTGFHPGYQENIEKTEF